VKVNQIIKRFSIVVLSIVIAYIAFGYVNSYFGWYGYKKWLYRKQSDSIEDSKRRGVFVKELHFKVDSFQRNMDWFKPYLERGFRWGHESSQETDLLITDYPYQIAFENNVKESIYPHYREDQFVQFDSFNVNRGYFKAPHLKDTMVLVLGGEGIHSGTIKIWE
jgi:hypothetical protein